MNYQTVLNLRVSLVVLALVLIFVLSPVLVASFDAWNKSACDYKEIPAFYWTFTNVGHCAAIKTIGTTLFLLGLFAFLSISVVVFFAFDPNELIYRLRQGLKPKGHSVAYLVQQHELRKMREDPREQSLCARIEFHIGYALKEQEQSDATYAVGYQLLGLQTPSFVTSDITQGFKTTVVLTIDDFKQVRSNVNNVLTINISCISRDPVKEFVISACVEACKFYRFEHVRISFAQIPFTKTP